MTITTATTTVPAERVLFANGYPDAPECICGNTVGEPGSGFYEGDTLGTYQTGPHETFVCIDCGRIMTEQFDDKILERAARLAAEQRGDDVEVMYAIPGAGYVIGRLTPEALAAQLASF